MNYSNAETHKVNNRPITHDDFKKLTIKDGVIAYFDIHDMMNKVVPFTMSSKEFKELVKTFDFENLYAEMPKWSEDNGVERMLTIPFSYHYYSYVAKHGTPPSPAQFVQSYVKDYMNVFTIRGKTYGKFKARFQTICSDKAFILTNMKSRILRAYNSFNRELALLIMLQEEVGENTCIMYDISKDMDDGIDILVEKKNTVLGIATYVNSNRANVEKNRKRKGYHHNIEILDYAAEKVGENKNVEFFGDVMLYSTKSVKEYVELLKKKFA